MALTNYDSLKVSPLSERRDIRCLIIIIKVLAEAGITTLAGLKKQNPGRIELVSNSCIEIYLI
jgi:hypothetical protein